jgi:Cu/Ag efflux pump CusA
MLRSIVTASVRLRLLVVLAAAILLAIGASQAHKAPVDVLPEFSAPIVQVQTESLGLSAPEVEQLVTVPMEQDLLNGVEGVQTIRSQSVPGLSSIVLTFPRGSDVFRARQLVQERLTQIAVLPNVLSTPPAMRQPVSSTNRVMTVGLNTTHLSPIRLSVLARWTVRPRLLGLSGVANVAIWGLRDRQLQVKVDPKRLHRHGVTLNDVISTVGNSQLVSPLSYLTASSPGTGGFVDGPNQRLSVRHVLPFGAPRTLGQVPIDGKPGVRLGSITKVVAGHPPLIGDAVVKGGHGLQLVIEKFPGASTVKVTNEVKAALNGLRPGLHGVNVDTSVFQPAGYIHKSEHNLKLLALFAGLLLLLVVAAFTLRWRTVLVTAVAVAASMVAAVGVLYVTGQSINALLVAGLLAALAVVVDDAVGDSVNIARRIERRRAGEDDAPNGVVAAALEMRSSLGYATLIVVLAVAPVLVANGLSASFVRPMALAFIAAVLASMVVALTVTPALTVLLASRGRGEARGRALGERASALYERLLARTVRMPRVALLVACAAGLIGLAVLPWLRAPSPPSFKDRNLLVQLHAAPGTSLPEMDRVTTRMARELRGVAGVQDVGADIGRAITGDQIVGTNASEVWVTMKGSADYGSTLRGIESVAHGTPGVDGQVRTYESDRSAGVLTAPGHNVTVRVYGERYGVLGKKAAQVRHLMAGVQGVRHPAVSSLTTQPTFQVKVNLNAAFRHGLKPGDVRRAASTLMQGLVVGDFFDQQKVFEVVVLGFPSRHPSVQQLRSTPLDTPNGSQVRLGDIAAVKINSAPVDIRHDATARYVDVTGAVSGRSASSVQHDIESRLKQVSFPLEYHAEVLGGANAHTTQGRFASYVVAAALGIFLLMQAAFRNWRLAILLTTLLPLALTGGIVVALIAGIQHSLGAYAGLLAVFCIAARQGLLILKRIETIAEEDGAPGDAEAALRGARDRFLPTIASATATLAALVPFIVAGDQPGNEITRDMAAVIAGGLVTSTLLITLMLPAAYAHLRLGRRLRAAVRGKTAAMPTTVIAVLGLVVLLSGCSSSAAEPSARTSAPAKVLHQGKKTTIVLSPTAERRIDVKTGVASRKGHRVTVPYASILYDPNGHAIAYTNPTPNHYVRTDVVVKRFKGNTAVLNSGPPSGTRVVTQGSDEILGVDEGVQGEN